MLTIIAAISKDRVIGKDGKIPWHIPEDLKRFRELTVGHPVIMGRKTFESIGRPLLRRTNIVITSNGNLPGVITCKNIEEALAQAKELDSDRYIIGGQRVYGETIVLADKLEITEVHGDYEGDTFFPRIDSKDWEVSLRQERKECSFVTYMRKK